MTVTHHPTPCSFSWARCVDANEDRPILSVAKRQVRGRIFQFSTVYRSCINSQVEWAVNQISRSRCISTSSKSKMVLNSAILTTGWYEVVCGPPLRAVFNYLQLSIMQISTARRYLTLNISETIRDIDAADGFCVPIRQSDNGPIELSQWPWPAFKVICAVFAKIIAVYFPVSD